MAQHPPTPAASPTASALPAAREPRVATANSLELHEQTNCVWRLIAAPGTTKEDLESARYCDAIAGKLLDFDLVEIVTSDRQDYFRALVAMGGRDGTTGASGGRARLQVLPGFPIRITPIDRSANDGLPESYRVQLCNTPTTRVGA